MGPNGDSLEGEPSGGLVGQTVANYHVLALIGQGGMGAVYLAEHAVLGRRAAVKVLLPEFSNNRELVSRFFDEARATAQLRHRGFVEVFDSGNLGDGSAYLIMDYLRGASLADCIEHRGNLPLAETLLILGEVARSVGFAHRHGIVHRDLKPDNIFLSAERPEGTDADDPTVRDEVTVKVLDFGIAKLGGTAGGGDGRQSARTRSGVLLGTPLYMSPEQCRGAGKVDHRTDIYSVGCIAYNMLTGKPPFAYDGFGEIISAHMHEAPALLRASVPSIPASVETLVFGLLAKSPVERPQSMEAVAGEIDRLRAQLGGGVPDLLSLVPPRRLAGAIPSLPGLSGARGRVATTPMPRTGPGLQPKPRGAISGGTQLMPPEAGAAVDTVAPAEPLRRRRPPSTSQEPPPSRRGMVILAALVAAVGLGALAFVLLRPDGAGSRTTQPPAETDDHGPSRRAVVAPEEPPAPPVKPQPAEVAAPPPKPAREEQVSVVVRIKSTPAGATVVEARTGKTLGETPFEGAFARERGEARLVLRKSGYRSKELTVKLGSDADLSVTLDKRKAAEPAEDSGDDRRKL